MRVCQICAYIVLMGFLFIFDAHRFVAATFGHNGKHGVFLGTNDCRRFCFPVYTLAAAEVFVSDVPVYVFSP